MRACGLPTPHHVSMFYVVGAFPIISVGHIPREQVLELWPQCHRLYLLTVRLFPRTFLCLPVPHQHCFALFLPE
jgi:hypothetical protein